ncbi:MAG: hypothetical protein KAS01_02890 [Candidatus Pacebacteria bacterium]|nr:hypothetical protein [Candidatus Paceibacterota bacterium]
MGSNIVQLASKFNYDDIKVLVIVDDDKDGKLYRDKILKIEGAYNSGNVFTIRDIAGDVKNNGTIEDLLGKDFIESMFKEFYRSGFGENCDCDLLERNPFIEQIKKILNQQSNFSDEILEKFKKKVSNDFAPSVSSFDEKFPLLKSLVDEIKEKI